jgi:subtilisin family serine protease
VGALLSQLLATLVASSQAKEPRNERLKPSPELRRQYQQTKHRRRRRLHHIRGLNLDEEAPPSDMVRRVTVRCSVEPLFRCASCAQALRDEQDAVLAAILKEYPDSSLVAASRKIANSLFVYLPVTQNDGAVDYWVKSLPGVVGVHPSYDYSPNVAEVVEYIGANAARETYCVTGKGVRVAVLDSGIDYTHAALGGPGTIAAFQAAFGTGLSSVENTQRDGLFPTERVVDGYDFVGDELGDDDFAIQAQPDDDPIDMKGHGTAVASAILGVAPDADLVAIKVCVTVGLSCPDFAVVLGIEYALDPNDDGNIEDKVDIINFSLGAPYTSGYYSNVATALDAAFELGVLSVVASGNDGNVPYNLGEESKTTNGIAVAATGTSTPGTAGVGTVESYSSRGPGENNSIKPDITAPAGFAMADASTGNGFFAATGTSFAAPIVAGAVALLKERCPECSALVLRTILMNNADPSVRYFSVGAERAPVSLVGSGEVQVNKALEADFYAYCAEDAQPSISLGLIDAASDVIIRRTLRIVNLSSAAQELTLGFLFREQEDADSGAVAVSFPASVLTVGETCGSELLIDVEFRITAALAPPNVMTSGGTAADDVRKLDRNEFDGWITISSTDKDISLPFHMLLRQAAEVSIANPVLPSITGPPVDVPIDLVNNGAGVAQIDSYELLFVSQDDPENPRGSNDPPSDLRYVGYRVLPVFDEGCDYVLEFAITTWERAQRLYLDYFEVVIDTDGDLRPEYTLVNSGPLFGSSTADGRIFDVATGEQTCAGFVIDHSTNTANTVLRVCSNDLNLSTEPQTINVGVISYSYPNTDLSDRTAFSPILFPEPALEAPSYDVLPGDSLDNISVSGPGGVVDRAPALGLLLMTNAYRDSSSTGAATQDTEALVILRQGIADPAEITPDVEELPVTEILDGPSDCSWEDVPLSCLSAPSSIVELEASADTNVSLKSMTDRNPVRRLQTSICPENSVPRSSLVTQRPTTGPTTSAPSAPVSQRPTTLSPTASLTTVPTTASPSSGPTARPTTATPSAGPTSAPSTSIATGVPTFSPTVKRVPSTSPTLGPTRLPTETAFPTILPAGAPSSGAGTKIQLHLTLTVGLLGIYMAAIY